MTSVVSLVVFAWIKTHHITNYKYNSVTYNVDTAFCNQLLPRLYEDTVLTWSTFNCDDVKTLIRDSFDEWQHNSMISFLEVTNANDATVTIRADFLSRPSVIAQAGAHAGGGVITIDENECWYTDRDFCASVSNHIFLIWFLVCLMWAITAGIGLYLIVRPLSRVDAIARVVNWAIFISCPLILFSALYPCTYCFDFRYTMMHEVGHILGFGHSDDEGQSCGCFNSTTTCTLGEEEKISSIMHSTVQHRSNSCLSRNDVDGLRAYYGPTRCDEKIWCYENTTFAGHSRIAVAIVYGFTLSWMFVLVRGRIYDACWGVRRRAHRILVIKRLPLRNRPVQVISRYAASQPSHASHPPRRGPPPRQRRPRTAISLPQDHRARKRMASRV